MSVVNDCDMCAFAFAWICLASFFLLFVHLHIAHLQNLGCRAQQPACLLSQFQIMCIDLLLRVHTHIDCLFCALAYCFSLALMIKGQAAQLCKRLVAPEAMVVPTMPGQLACFLGVMCWISMMAPKKRKCSKGAPDDDDGEPVATPKAKAKAKPANAK